LNCYERCKPNTFAPTTNSWGYDNRTVGFRVKNSSPGGTYIENRIPGASSNPYLVTMALQCLQEDELFVRELGDVFMKAFVESKKDEIEREKKRSEENKWEWYREFYKML